VYSLYETARNIVSLHLALSFRILTMLICMLLQIKKTFDTGFGESDEFWDFASGAPLMDGLFRWREAHPLALAPWSKETGNVSDAPVCVHVFMWVVVVACGERTPSGRVSYSLSLSLSLCCPSG
jgi:hypothetical protein